MNIEQERTYFEAFASRHGLCITEDNYLYRSHLVAWMWRAWQARAALQSQDREDAERYRWVKRHSHPNRGFDEWCLPCVDYVNDNLDTAIDHARRIEDKT